MPRKRKKTTKMTTTKTRTIENTCFKPAYLAGSNPALSATKKSLETIWFQGIFFYFQWISGNY